MGFIQVGSDEQYGILYKGKEYEIKCTGSDWKEVQKLLDKENIKDKDVIKNFILYVKKVLPDLDVDNIDVFDIIMIVGGINRALGEKVKNELSLAE